MLLYIVAGNHMVLADMNHQWQLGLTICYDLRFPELYQALRCPHAISDGGKVMVSSSSDPRAECDVILVPSAFTCKTGEAHWEILLRARAIETQSYVIAAAQSGLLFAVVVAIAYCLILSTIPLYHRPA